MAQLQPISISNWSRVILTLLLSLMVGIPSAQGSPYMAMMFGANKPLTLKYITSAQNVYASACSGTVTVQALKGGVPANVAPALTVSLAGTSGVTFYSDENCTVSVLNITIASGTNSNSFFFLDNSTGSVTLTASALKYSSATQSETLSTNPFVWTGGAGSGNTDVLTGANWSGGVAPNTSQTGIFDGTCGANCNATISQNVGAVGVRTTSAYTGTITVNSGVSTQLGDWGDGTAVSISGGTLDASAATYLNTAYTTVAIAGTGTIKAPSGSGTWDIYKIEMLAGGGTLNAGTGTINITGTDGIAVSLQLHSSVFTI
jgi:hypothetical protein